MSRSRKQSEAVTLRYGRHLTHREIAEAVRRTPALRRRATPPTRSDVTRALEPEVVTRWPHEHREQLDPNGFAITRRY
jgi:DNA-directed RNA polymerase specialized sigma24 family protein